MLLVQNGFNCEYEMNVFLRLYFNANDDVYVYTNVSYENDIADAYCEIIYNGDIYFGEFSLKRAKTGIERKDNRICSVSCTRAFINAADKIYKISLPWGAMCGVRPAKTVTSLVGEGMSYEDAAEFIKLLYGVEDDKCELACKVSKNEQQILSSIKDNSVSIYIGIPFCPSRCLYCSFVSTDIGITGKYIDDFLECLLKEIDITADIIKDTGKVIENIYIGGGTPTTLNENQLEKLLKKINNAFDIKSVNEFTLEAGRPDTITREKLEIAKKYNVGRVSINPQTTNNKTLAKIGRRHCVQMFFEAYKLAREVGFDVINTDLLAGLPDESFEDFKKSIDDIIEISPENITVHSMCIKRAAVLRYKIDELTEADEMNKMLSYTQKKMEENGYTPYYMYRQKNISGNLENVGYAKEGTFSFYNVNIMEEAQTIIALGGGGTTKIVKKEGIERIFNYK
ncbi:MAG: coproporphyrinogen dehydrogenase HemZ, partial [Eubacteriales bacterium]|nr:coproporphyrinogen dehydrogenase HemZ [Eubacteriales bacterium]